MEYTGPEKRKYKRIKRPFTARVRFLNEKIEPLERPVKEDSNWDVVIIKDISAGGISFSYVEKIPIGSTLEFSIMLPFARDPIHCFGRVCRVDGADSNKPEMKFQIYVIAASFIEISPANQKAISEYAREISRF
ncbi:MAG: PilZ domain-containing protein [Candidatus Omnitrophica bacterium]|nr:PilZ domain-containing protein [Candidatus Omnitrophota bacterium]